MSIHHNDLRSLYRQAMREARPTRADRRAVRAAMLSAGVASSALHATTAAGKLISLVPGGAKVLTLGQVVTYACVGVAMGGSLAVVSTVTAAHDNKVAVVQTSVAAPRRARARPALQAARTFSDESPKAALASPTSALPVAPNQPNAPVQAAHQSANQPSTEQVASATPPVPAVALPLATSSAPQSSSLVAESQELGAVQAALGSKDAARALQLLDAQDRTFRGGSLTQERSAARVMALCIAGRTSQAQLARQNFLSAYPGSPWVRRINTVCTK